MNDDGRPLLFTYGTLAPDGPAPGRSPDAIQGRMYDLGPHPILVDWNDEAADWVVGSVRATSGRELADDLDVYEGVAGKYFARLLGRTREGREVWVYVYLGDVPQYAKGPLSRWDGPRRSPAS